MNCSKLKFFTFYSVVQNFFKQADITKDGLLSLEEVKKFLKKKQLVLPKQKLIELIKVKDFVILNAHLFQIFNLRKSTKIMMDSLTKKNLQI